MISMTGYAFCEQLTDQFTFSIELKSLNSRYLEIFCNLPRIIRTEETDLNSIIKNRFSRGKIELNIDIYDWAENKPISLNDDLIEKYYHRLIKIKKKLGVTEPLSLDSVLQLEGITQRERSSLNKKTRDMIYSALEKVIKKAIEMRRKEGAAISRDIKYSLSIIKKEASEIKKFSQKSITEKQDKLQKKLAALTDGGIDEIRLYSEIAIMADKLDVNEEIVRLNDHMNKMKEYMKEEGQIGRKMDFIAQEMFREVNTIASKSCNSSISHLVVDIKNHIDKIREHCRNLV